MHLEILQRTKSLDTTNMNENALHQLTMREKEVLIIISDGSTNKETAKKLNISVRTVETHRKNIMQKLDVKNIAGLIKFCILNNLTPLD